MINNFWISQHVPNSSNYALCITSNYAFESEYNLNIKYPLITPPICLIDHPLFSAHLQSLSSMFLINFRLLSFIGEQLCHFMVYIYKWNLSVICNLSMATYKLTTWQREQMMDSNTINVFKDSSVIPGRWYMSASLFL